jgi:hypothetical protein
MAEVTRNELNVRWSALKNERSSWIPHWEDISRFLLPRHGRFFLNQANRGEKKHNNIIDSTGTRSLSILSAGMQSNMTSPARPWFRLSTSDPKLDESYAVKVWLSETTRLMQMVFARSNTYRSLHMMYEELGAFGTAASIVLPDFDTIICQHPLTIGEYAIATNFKGQTDTLYREFELKVAQIVKEFGVDNVSDGTRAAYNRGNLDQWRPVMHVIEPRADRDPRKRNSKNMPWKSVYFEMDARPGQFLRESGFREFSALCPRWKVRSGDEYGSSPGMDALGDVKQLQQQHLRKGQGIDYMTRPPLQLPSSMQGKPNNFLPGGHSYYDGVATPQGAVRAAFEVNLNLQHLREDIVDVRERVRQCFFADLFLMLANDTRSGTTAYEIAQRQEEKMLMLGPVVERLHSEILEPLIEMTFSRMVEANIVPPAPPEMQGMELNVEFVSVLAQAQRAVATGSVDRYVANLGNIAQFKPEVMDKFDADHWADAYADMLGVDPELIVPSEQVAFVRKSRAEAAAQQMQAQQMVDKSTVARNMAQAKTGEQNMLTDVMEGTTGYT